MYVTTAVTILYDNLITDNNVYVLKHQLNLQVLCSFLIVFVHGLPVDHLKARISYSCNDTIYQNMSYCTRCDIMVRWTY